MRPAGPWPQGSTSTASGGAGVSQTRRMVLLDGSVTFSGGAAASGIPAGSETPGQVYGLTVSGPGVITHVDPGFRAGPGPVKIVVEARAEASGSAAMKAPVSESRILGDVDANGRVDILDAILVALYSRHPSNTPPNDGNFSLGDVNGDGRVGIADVTLIATYSLDPAHPSLPAGIGESLIVVAEGKMYWVDQGKGQDPAGEPRRLGDRRPGRRRVEGADRPRPRRFRGQDVLD